MVSAIPKVGINPKIYTETREPQQCWGFLVESNDTKPSPQSIHRQHFALIVPHLIDDPAAYLE